MTSREMSGSGCQDQFDAMVSWALRESVADVNPPEGTWERISDRLHREGRTSRSERWRVLRVAASAAILGLVHSALGPPAGFAYCDRPEFGPMRERYDLRLLMYQNDLPMLLAQAV